MAEPASGAAVGFAATFNLGLFGKLVALFSSGAVGAWLMALL